MQLSKYISDLLYRYDCVIVPDFGGFVTNTEGTKINPKTHQFTPPTQKVSFNRNLNHNDGLLVNHIASELHTDFDTAKTWLDKTVEGWKKDLLSNPLLLDKIGQLHYENDQLVFEPVNEINYLTSSFGLSSVDANLLLRENLKPQIVEKKSYKKVIGVGIAAAVTALFIGANFYSAHQNKQNELIAQQEVTTKIQQASFDILNPLPTITVKIEKELKEEMVETFAYHVVAGAFKEKDNALYKVDQLKNKGYNAHIIGLNQWGLTQVAYASFHSKREATNVLYSIRKQDQNPSAWLLIME